jgi:two-component system LytT family sensor kinase
MKYQKRCPLTVHIKTIDGTLEVSNNLQLRTQSEASSKTGLKNINERYKYFTNKTVDVIEDNHSFKVRIPLLHSK